MTTTINTPGVLHDPTDIEEPIEDEEFDSRMTTSRNQPTTQHPLSLLVGKTIESIIMQEIDMYGTGENVRQFYTINCAGDEQHVLAVEGHCTLQYATATLMTPSEFAELLADTPSADEDEEDEKECCQRCSFSSIPEYVIILNDLGPVCRDCCTPEDIKQAIAEGTFDEQCLDGQSPEEFLEEWQADGPV